MGALRRLRRLQDTLARLGEDTRALGHGERGIGLVFEAQDGAALVVIAHPTLETDEAAAGVAVQRGLQRGGIEWRFAEVKTAGRGVHAQPPATGGMNTTVSPSRRGVSQGTKASLTAARS